MRQFVTCWFLYGEACSPPLVGPPLVDWSLFNQLSDSVSQQGLHVDYFVENLLFLHILSSVQATFHCFESSDHCFQVSISVVGSMEGVNSIV
jgi:hypothetical protein